MIRTIVVGLWACVVALVSSYAAASWMAGGKVTVEKPGPLLTGMDYVTLPPLTVPMIADGQLRGYVVAKLVFTADTRTLSHMPVDPQPFMMDEAFRRIYTDGQMEFDKMSKANLDEITKAIRENVNKRLGTDLIRDVLVSEVSFVDKEAIKAAAQKSGG